MNGGTEEGRVGGGSEEGRKEGRDNHPHWLGGGGDLQRIGLQRGVPPGEHHHQFLDESTSKGFAFAANPGNRELCKVLLSMGSRGLGRGLGLWVPRFSGLFQL